MAKQEKPRLFVMEDTYTEHGFTMTRMVLRVGTEESIDAQIEGCIDNKAGYETMEAAERQHKRYSYLKAQGYLGMYRSHFSGENVTLEWQHGSQPNSDGSIAYCEMTVCDLPRRVSEIKVALRLIDRLFKAGERLGHREYQIRHSPAYMRDILARLHATPLVMVEIPRSVDSYCTWSEWCTAKVLTHATAHKVAL